MYDDGYQNIVNIDVSKEMIMCLKMYQKLIFCQYSSVVVEQMKQRHGETRSSMEWHEMDIRDLKFDDNSFDVAIDKGQFWGCIYPDLLLTFQ